MRSSRRNSSANSSSQFSSSFAEPFGYTFRVDDSLRDTHIIQRRFPFPSHESPALNLGGLLFIGWNPHPHSSEPLSYLVTFFHQEGLQRYVMTASDLAEMCFDLKLTQTILETRVNGDRRCKAHLRILCELLETHTNQLLEEAETIELQSHLQTRAKLNKQHTLHVVNSAPLLFRNSSSAPSAHYASSSDDDSDSNAAAPRSPVPFISLPTMPVLLNSLSSYIPVYTLQSDFHSSMFIADPVGFKVQEYVKKAAHGHVEKELPRLKGFDVLNILK
eukprot:GILI01025218.1.p1 GENE.GILI01025218.1~~GILI01025218.1.p1  ORF type:complete len:275 (+),score=35.03 GILI01025218.1:53-877(+)